MKKKEMEVVSPADPLLDVQVQGWTGSWTYSWRPEDSLPETGILTVPGTDWRCHEHDGMRREGREGRNTSRRRAASWPCKENYKIQTKKKQLTKQKKTKNSHFRLNWKKSHLQAQTGIVFFFLKEQHFVFSCTSPPCFFHFVYSKQVYL